MQTLGKILITGLSLVVNLWVIRKLVLLCVDHIDTEAYVVIMLIGLYMTWGFAMSSGLWKSTLKL